MKKQSICIFLIVLMLSCKKDVPKSSIIPQPVLNKDTIVAANNELTKDSFDILKYLLHQEIKKNGKYSDLNEKNYSVRFPNDGDPYSYTFSQIASDDLNADGITDYIVDKTSEGMLGGNANTNAEIWYIIMGKNNTISQKHEILQYAPFSYNLLSDFKYYKKILEAEVAPNPKAFDGNQDEFPSSQLSFIYKDGNLYEESYLVYCQLAKWQNKKILNNRTQFVRTIEMHNYTEVLKETYKDKSQEIEVELSGCDNLVITLEGNYPTKDFSANTISQKKEAFFNYLIQNSNLKSEITTAKQIIDQNPHPKNILKSGNLEFNLFINEYKDEKKINFRLNLSKINNPNQLENWDITTRKQKK